MNNHDIQPNPELSADQAKLVACFSKEEREKIDQAVLSHTSTSWRKITRVVGSAAIELNECCQDVPGIYFAQRVRKMVAEGVLEHQGYLESMCYCEVRRVV
jgi:hypothetical protein